MTKTPQSTAVAQRPSAALPDEVIQGTRTWDDDTLLAIQSFEDAVALVTSEHGDIEDAAEVLGNGFVVLSTEQKQSIIGVPLLLMDWRFNDGDQGRFVSIMAIGKSLGRMIKVVINDGSTGIMDQIAKYQAKTGRTGGLMVRNGLRRSDYTYVDDEGNDKPATTYYLDTSA